MKAIAITAPNQLELIEIADPTPGNSEVVVEVAAVGICGTDLHILKVSLPRNYQLFLVMK